MRNRAVSLFFALTFLFAGVAFAANPGAVGTPFQSLVCHDSTCASPTPGTINWKPTGTTAVVIDSVSGLSGYIWGNELGWIKLNPTGEGVTFANASTGLLTGKAWSQVSGWINFAPTGQTVTIDPSTGQFSGFAWTGGPFGGWIKFDCSDNDSCVDTTWNLESVDGANPGSVPRLDSCRNIDGIQLSIPQGYGVTIDGSCVPIVDRCPNIPGDQQTIPVGFVVNAIQACVPHVDYCANIAGIQTAVPDGYIVGASGACVSASIDACPDVSGIQTSADACGKKDLCANLAGEQGVIPSGFMAQDGMCMPEALDMCINIDGAQFVIPLGMMLTGSGECVPEPFDACGNLAGYQSDIPLGFYEKNGACFLGALPGDQSSAPSEVVAFTFIPRAIQVPVQHELLDRVVRVLRFNNTDAFAVDATSAVLFGGAILFLMYLLIRVVRLAIK